MATQGEAVCIANSRTASFRGRHGGVEKRGGWKTSRMTPLPKRGFGPPPRTVRFLPPSGVSALFFLYKNPRQGVQNFSGERVLWYVFLPPYVLHPPISRPKSWGPPLLLPCPLSVPHAPFPFHLFSLHFPHLPIPVSALALPCMPFSQIASLVYDNSETTMFAKRYASRA